MLQNRIYRGDIVHQGTAYPGQHAAILDPELWQIVQNKLAVHRQERALAVGAEAPSLLAGLIVEAGGNRMTPTQLVAAGKPKLIALVAVARKLITIHNAILRDRRPWQPITISSCSRPATCWQPGGDQCCFLASRKRSQRSPGPRRSAPWSGSTHPGYSGARALTSSNCLSSFWVSVSSTAARLS